MRTRSEHEQRQKTRERLKDLDYPLPPEETVQGRPTEPGREPEYVGAHSMLVGTTCNNVYDGDPENTELNELVPVQCDRDATHTIVMADGSGLHEVPRCDECGNPDGVDRDNRTWTGDVRDSSQSIRRSEDLEVR